MNEQTLEEVLGPLTWRECIKTLLIRVQRLENAILDTVGVYNLEDPMRAQISRVAVETGRIVLYLNMPNGEIFKFTANEELPLSQTEQRANNIRNKL